MDLCTILVHINNYKSDINLYQIYVSGVLKCASIISQMFLCISPYVSLNVSLLLLLPTSTLFLHFYHRLSSGVRSSTHLSSHTLSHISLLQLGQLIS